MVQELAEKVLQCVERLKGQEQLKMLITQLVDQCLAVQNLNERFKLKLETTIKTIQKEFQGQQQAYQQKQQAQTEQLLQSLQQKQVEYNQMRSIKIILISEEWCKRSLEKIELSLYEKNNYQLLKSVIDQVQLFKKHVDKKYLVHSSDVSVQSTKSIQNNECNQAFYADQSQMILNNTNIVIQDTNLQPVIDLINRSSLSIKEKEQIYFNLLKSNPASQQNSQIHHVQLQDILNISNPKSELTHSGVLPEPKKKNKEASIQLSPIRKGDQSSVLNLEEFLNNDALSPKFQLAELSPINKENVIHQTGNSFRGGSFSPRVSNSSKSVFKSIQQKLQNKQDQVQFFKKEVSEFKPDPPKRTSSVRQSEQGTSANSFYLKNLMNRINRSKNSFHMRRHPNSDVEDQSKSFSIKMTPYRRSVAKQDQSQPSDKPLLEKKFIQQMSKYCLIHDVVQQMSIRPQNRRRTDQNSISDSRNF